MRNQVYFLFIILLFSLSAKSQYAIYEYGKLEPADMQMEVCPIDPAANAVIICDIGKIWFAREVDEFHVVVERFMRYKILNDEGTSNRFLKIPLYHEGKVKEKLSGLVANTWNETDRVWKTTELPKRLYDQEQVNDNYEIITVEFPNVKKGSIIEFKYSINSPFFMPIHGWEFQSSIPTLLSFLEVRMIPFYEYTFLHQGRKPDIQKSFKGSEERSIGKNINNQYGNIKFNEMIYHFGMTNMPATQDNPARIDFQLSREIDLNGVPLKLTDTWEKTIKELTIHDHFGDFIDKVQGRAKNLIELDYYTPMPTAERIYSIVRYVKDKYEWNGILGKYAPISVNDFIDIKKGSAGTINLFTIGLLRAADINAFPIILTTKENLSIKTDYPFLHLYDYVLIGIKEADGIRLTDATEDLLPDDLIPLRCLGTRGLIIERGPEQWITCNTPVESSTTTSIIVYAPNDNELTKVEIDKTADGYDAFLLKREFHDTKAEIANHYKNKGYIAQEDNITTRNFDKLYEPYSINAQLMIPMVTNGQTISIDPFMNEAMNVNPLKEETRDYPADFYYALDKQYNSEIIIPEGYTITKMPENFSMSNSLLEISYKVSTEAGKVHVNASYKMPKAVYPPSEYSKIRTYLNEVVKRFNEPIVIQKANN